LGFLLGSTLTGASIYYYILDEYKVSNELLTEDIYVCQLMPIRASYTLKAHLRMQMRNVLWQSLA
jgi:hypothetical protein